MLTIGRRHGTRLTRRGCIYHSNTQTTSCITVASQSKYEQISCRDRTWTNCGGITTSPSNHPFPGRSTQRRSCRPAKPSLFFDSGHHVYGRQTMLLVKPRNLIAIQLSNVERTSMLRLSERARVNYQLEVLSRRNSSIAL